MVHALRHGLVLVAVSGIGSVPADVLTVAAALLVPTSPSLSSPSSPSNHTLVLFTPALAPTIVAIVILATLTATSSVIYARWSRPFLRRPAFIAAVLAYVHGNRMLAADFGNDDTAGLSTQQLEARLWQSRGRDDHGKKRETVGEGHVNLVGIVGEMADHIARSMRDAVDERPVLSRYVRRATYLRATTPWMDI